MQGILEWFEERGEIRRIGEWEFEIEWTTRTTIGSKTKYIVCMDFAHDAWRVGDRMFRHWDYSKVANN